VITDFGSYLGKQPICDLIIQVAARAKQEPDEPEEDEDQQATEDN
jgi:hypothetical protein